ncbi:MAG: helix-turn-helix domain-containing protein [Chthoniobacterales bacterium]|nr:helix-turn-helix domain-containing protein [Chthoniobacterales bacterium]
MIVVLKLDGYLRPGEIFHLQSDLRTSRWGVSMHTHCYAEVFWIFQGKARHHVNGVTLDLGAGSVVFIRPHDVHSVEKLPHGPLGFANLAFSTEHLREIQHRYFQNDPLWPWSEASLPEIRVLERAQLDRLRDWTGELATASRSARELDRFLLSLLHLIAVSAGARTLPTGIPDWLARACRGIREPEAMREGVPAWVRLCGRGSEHVARTTRAWLGVSPTEYVNAVRLQAFECQLRCTATPIIELGMSVGFESVGHLYARFKARYGMPPNRYRRVHWGQLV